MERSQRPDLRLEPWSDEGGLALLTRLNTPELTEHLGGPETPEKLTNRHRRYLGLDDRGQMFRITLVGGMTGGTAGGTTGGTTGRTADGTTGDTTGRTTGGTAGDTTGRTTGGTAGGTAGVTTGGTVGSTGSTTGGTAGDTTGGTVGSIGVTVGSIGYWETTWQGETVWETGWGVLPEFQGRGVAADAARLVAEKARAAGRHAFLHAFPATGHGASNAVCRKAGFTLRGEASIEYPAGNWHPCNDWRLALGGP